MGRAAQTGVGDTAAVAIGYHPYANGKFSMAFGNYTRTNQPNSFAFGYKAVANHSGSFITATNLLMVIPILLLKTNLWSKHPGEQFFTLMLP